MEVSRSAAFTQHDYLLLAVAGGIITVTGAFLTDFVPLESASYLVAFLLGLTCITVSMIASLVAAYVSTRAHDRYLDIVDDAFRSTPTDWQAKARDAQDKDTEADRIRRWNRVAFLALILSILCIAIFVALNVVHVRDKELPTLERSEHPKSCSPAESARHADSEASTRKEHRQEQVNETRSGRRHRREHKQLSHP